MGRTLVSADAERGRAAHELLDFRCWSGDPAQPWVAEVEEYIQRFALKTAFKVLLFRGLAGDLAGVTAFDRTDVRLSGRRRTAVWRLQVVALSLSWQGTFVDNEIEGCETPMKAGEFLIRRTYQRMLELDPRRVIAIARVHDDNRASMRTSQRVGLLRTARESDEYWTMLGEVDPAAQGCG